MGTLLCIYTTQIKIWDTAGSEKYMSVATAYYRKADGVIMVFDVTSEKTFVNIQSRWMDAIMSEDRSVSAQSAICSDG